MTLSGGTPVEIRDAVSRRAGEFFERRRFGEWSDADQVELDAWVAEATLHRIAYLRLEGIAADTERLVAVRPFRFGRRAPGGFGAILHRGFVLPLLAAASVALAATFGGRFVAYLLQPADRADSTDVGGRTLLTYSDRTQIELNTNTAVRVRMTTAERTVWLDKGEAWFHVAHDAAHPFTVIVGRDCITDIGTDFLIRRDANNVDVTLLNGRAVLSTQGVQTATLTPGDEATATPATLSVTRKTPQELEGELAWRRGILVFRDTKLADAIREVNRYHTIKLVIADPSVGELKFNGEVKSDNLEEFLGLVQVAMNLHADRQGKDIVLSRANPGKSKKGAHTKREL